MERPTPTDTASVRVLIPADHASGRPRGIKFTCVHPFLDGQNGEASGLDPEVLHYHHPSAENFSLAQSSESPQELRRRSQNGDESTKLLGYPFDTPVYVRYVGDSRVRTAAEAAFDQDRLAAEITALPEPAQIVAFRLVELFQATVAARNAAQFSLYKPLDLQRVNNALDRVSWGAELPQVAGELMSNLILRHSLPNANHRTSIVVLQFCIEAVEPSFRMPEAGRDGRAWNQWADPYIRESKRLLTVRRNNLYFKPLARLGVDVVERKGEVQTHLSDYDLDIPPTAAKERYAREHKQLCLEFTDRVLKEAHRTDLYDVAGPSLKQFVAYLDENLPERDPCEIVRATVSHRLRSRMASL